MGIKLGKHAGHKSATPPPPPPLREPSSSAPAQTGDDGFATYLRNHPEAREALKDAASADVVILHINDVYELEAGNNGTQGGMVNTASLVRLFAPFDPIFAFGGDAFSSGAMSAVFKGEDMVGAFNELGVDVAVIGNHEFDFDMKTAEARFGESRFPWLDANILNRDGNPISAQLAKSVILERNGHRIGFTGVVSDWEAEGSLAKGKLGPYSFVDDVQVAQEQAADLRQQGSEIEVALCHGNRDEAIASQTDIDIVLGGHNHSPFLQTLGNDVVLRAGSDMQNLGVVTIDFQADREPVIRAHNLPVMAEEIPDDAGMTAYVAPYLAKAAELNQVLATTSIPLDGRKEKVRTSATTLGNLVADSMKDYTGSEVAVTTGGSLRSERIHSAGPLTRRDVLDILPFADSLVTMDLAGAQIREALEGGLAKYPAADGSFPQVSGIEITFDPGREPGNRITALYINGEELQPERTYRVAMRQFLADGNGGYPIFAQGKNRQDDPAKKLNSDVFCDYLKKLGTVAETGSLLQQRVRPMTRQGI